jgi:hypothetical protein
MAITQAFPNAAKLAFMTGSHTPLHTYKIALYTNAAALDATTSAYSATNEVVGTGYTAGGQVLVGYTAALSGGTAYITWSTNPSWPTSTITANGAIIYNTSGSQAVAVIAFGSDYSSTNGTFTVTLPSAGATAIIRSA